MSAYHGDAAFRSDLAAKGGFTAKGDLFLGLLPFIVLGTAAIIIELPETFYVPGQSPFLDQLGILFFFGGYLLTVLGLFWGMLKGFPRWSMPYLVYGVLFALYIAGASTPGLVVFGMPLWDRELWGWRAYVLVGFFILLGLLLSRPPWKPVVQLLKNIWNDWTFLSFGLYGLMPMIGVILQDEVEDIYTVWPTLAAVLIVLAGAALYLLKADKPYRAAFLMAAVFLSVFIGMLSANYYWDTHEVNFTTGERTLLTGPVPWQKIILGAFNTAGGLTLILALPGVVGLLRLLNKKEFVHER